MSENSKLIMIHLYILYSQTLTDSYDPSGRQLITPHTHQYFKTLTHTLSLSHTHTYTHTHVYPSSVYQCVFEMSIMLHVEDLDTEGINKRRHQFLLALNQNLMHPLVVCY